MYMTQVPSVLCTDRVFIDRGRSVGGRSPAMFIMIGIIGFHAAIVVGVVTKADMGLYSYPIHSCSS